jgi:hypothetical protein
MNTFELEINTSIDYCYEKQTRINEEKWGQEDLFLNHVSTRLVFDKNDGKCKHGYVPKELSMYTPFNKQTNSVFTQEELDTIVYPKDMIRIINQHGDTTKCFENIGGFTLTQLIYCIVNVETMSRKKDRIVICKYSNGEPSKYVRICDVANIYFKGLSKCETLNGEDAFFACFSTWK